MEAAAEEQERGGGASEPVTEGDKLIQGWIAPVRPIPTAPSRTTHRHARRSNPWPAPS